MKFSSFTIVYRAVPSEFSCAFISFLFRYEIYLRHKMRHTDEINILESYICTLKARNLKIQVIDINENIIVEKLIA